MIESPNDGPLPVLIAGAVLLMLGTIALTVFITRLQDRRSS